MLNGNIENLYDYVAQQFIAQGRATLVDSESERGCKSVELAMMEPKAEHAVVKFFRTLRSRS